MSECEKCGSEVETIKTPETVHYAKEKCPEHGFQRWKTKPENKGKRNKTSSYSVKQIIDFHNQEERRCFFCRRKQEELGNNETLTRDHIHEESNGGKDELENLQILCTACHKLKNWMRLYNNWHFNGGPNGE